ncbi:type II secretion system F family protein [Roseibaca sp. Y0-43]|uniref:type II secretion system F family protein n=1 Tax=Roseibaca sp. Y0-43 TaxID=2816854 RepID=UPI001D0C6390|nr:type II secretion system F family protein [Roseibaca sp. Y0-43]MCC1482890.1 type II secretion system F family protein [Roseibaca sp. Y0-43]
MTENSLTVLLIFIAISLFILAIQWDRLFPDRLHDRVRKISDEKRTKTPVSIEGDDLQKLSLQSPEEESTWYISLYSPMQRLSKIVTPDLSRRLRRGGYHAPKHLVIFMLAKFVIPLIMFPLFWNYLDLVISAKLNFFALLLLTIVLSLASFWSPELFLKNTTLRRQERIKRAWPDTLVLMQLCIDSGLGLEAAMAKVIQEIRPISSEIADEFAITLAELIYFQNRRTALENLGDRVNLSSVREVTVALAQAERYGMALGATLNALAAESRRTRLAAAEKKAAALPARLTVPMILFFLPALFVVILSPAIIQVLEF